MHFWAFDMILLWSLMEVFHNSFVKIQQFILQHEVIMNNT